MTDRHSVSFDSFTRIRNRALLLTMGRQYLCEAPFLIKCGTEMEQALPILAKDIKGMKQRFPGKFAREIDTDGALKGLQDVARRMRSPDQTLQEKCLLGELGKELEERLRSLSEAMKEILLQVEGSGPKYSGKEALAGAFHGTGQAIRGVISTLGKIAGLVFLALALVLGYLFATMEREGSVKEDISRNQEQISVLEKELSRLEKEMLPLIRQIEEPRGRWAARSDMVRAMELSVKLGELESEASTIRGSLDLYQRRMKEAEASLEELRGKSFLERLLRRPSS